MKKIKCGFAISFNGPYYSNFVASIISLEKNMQQNSIDTVYVFPEEVQNYDWIHKLENLTTNIYYIKYNSHSFRNLKKIRKIFKREKVNLIYSRMSGWDFLVRFAFPTLPIIWHMDFRVNVVDRSRRILNWIKFNLIGFGKTYHIAPSKPVADAINLLNPKNKAVNIVNSLEFSRLIQNTEHSFKEPYKLLIFGWDPIVKGLDYTIDALEIINEKNNKIELIISSQSMTQDYLKKRYNGNNPKWISVIPPTDNVAELYNKADVMISASRSESFSFCLAEAIYTGMPVVFSDIDGTSWAKEFKCAYEFKTADVDDLVRCLESIPKHISADDLEYNRLLMQEKYSMDAWSKKIISFIKSIME